MILLTTNARLSRHQGLKEREKKMEIEFKKMTGDIGKIYHDIQLRGCRQALWVFGHHGDRVHVTNQWRLKVQTTVTNQQGTADQICRAKWETGIR